MNNTITNETFKPGLHNLKHVIVDIPPNLTGDTGYKSWTNKIDSLGSGYSWRIAETNDSTNLFHKEYFNGKSDKKLSQDFFFRNPKLEISGIIWENDWFLEANFKQCYFLSFDIDDGIPSLNDAITALNQTNGMLWTSKSHQKLNGEHTACDRYHVMLNFDKPILNLREYKFAMNAAMLVLCPTADKAMLNGSFKMRGGPENAILQPLGGNDYNVISVDKLIRFADDIPGYIQIKNDIWDRYDNNGKKACIEYFSGAIGEHKPDGNLKRVLTKFYTEKCNLEDTYRNIFKLMLNAFRPTLNSGKVKATILDMEELKPYYSKHRGQLTGIDATLNTAKNSYLSNSIGKIVSGKSLQPLNKLVVLKADELPAVPELVHAYKKKSVDINKINWDNNMEATLRLIHAIAHGDDRKAIVAVPPGLAKSTSATAIVAAYAATDRRYLIVKPSVVACDNQRKDLIALGVNNNDLSMLVGYADKHEICTETFRHGKNGPYHHCKDCKKNQDRDENGNHRALIERCAIGQTYTNRAEQMMKNVIIMTHQRFSTLWIENGIPSDLTIIIDEAMQSYDIINLDKYKLNKLSKLVPAISEHIKYLDSNLRDNCIRDEFNATRDDERFISEDVRAKLIEIMKAGDEYGKCDNPPDDVQDTIDMGYTAKAYLSAFYDKPEHGEAKRYVFDNCSDIVRKNEDDENKDNATETTNNIDDEKIAKLKQLTKDMRQKTYDVIKSRIYCDLPNRIIILDGSAIFSNTPWKGFTIYQIDIHKQILFDNVILHTFKGNPTITNVKSKFPQYADMIENDLKGRQPVEICIISNKQKEDSLEQTKRYKEFIKAFEDKNIKVKNLYRGTVIGSNLARDSHMIMVLASMFNGISETVLRTALRMDCGIEADKIWDYQLIDGKNGANIKRKVPKMNYGFEDSDLNETFMRTYADEIIQYILRGRARNYKGESEDVFFFSTGNLINEEIRTYLPGVQFAGDSGMKKLRDMTKEQIEDVSARELAEMFGYASHPNNDIVNELIRYRDMVYLEKINK